MLDSLVICLRRLTFAHNCILGGGLRFDRGHFGTVAPPAVGRAICMRYNGMVSRLK